MIRVTIELLPHGDEKRARTIGLVEIANTGDGTLDLGNYKKTPPFSGALIHAWRKGKLDIGEDEDIISGSVQGHPRQRRGIYDLLYRALKACGLEGRI